ncbi:helix-turn-helix domain-containing protein [Streptomyces rishiriensis]|uniref:helix-turn-helix domain-containing protein n=1 Tax=Streptomyces rishiriensis TaxID=68264 RepID=UPI0037CCC46D
MAYGHKSEHRLRVRAQVVLPAARGRSNARIARETGLHLDTVRCWRGRFTKPSLAGLSDRARSGRPPLYTALQVAKAKALACHLPTDKGCGAGALRPVSNRMLRRMSSRTGGTAGPVPLRRLPRPRFLRGLQDRPPSCSLLPAVQPHRARARMPRPRRLSEVVSRPLGFGVR